MMYWRSMISDLWWADVSMLMFFTNDQLFVNTILIVFYSLHPTPALHWNIQMTIKHCLDKHAAIQWSTMSAHSPEQHSFKISWIYHWQWYVYLIYLSVCLSVCRKWISLTLSEIDVWLLGNMSRKPGCLFQNLSSDLQLEVHFCHFGCFPVETLRVIVSYCGPAVVPPIWVIPSYSGGDFF